MKKDSLIYFMVFFFLVCFLCGFQKQEKAKKPLEHEVLVELVVVEVFVTDKEGNFVDNLTKDDFEIYEDGKKVEIYYFDIVSPRKEIIKEEFEEKVVEKKKPLPPQKMKLVVLFDNFNTNRVYLNRQWPQIEEMFRALSDKVEETMIMELNREIGMRVIQPFTSDPDLLTSKISNLRFDLWKDIEEDIRKREIEDLEIEARLAIEDRFLLNAEYIIRCLREEERVMRKIRLADSFSSFLATVNYIRQFDGIKSVLIISDGFHLERE
ncbi:MAG: VWA domain-containing protein, partial [Candidatus Aminicenantes bacterium]|nr:VWA domain-containing protein [Candidatus Aminicenantes bacterium]